MTFPRMLLIAVCSSGFDSFREEHEIIPVNENDAAIIVIIFFMGELEIETINNSNSQKYNPDLGKTSSGPPVVFHTNESG